jgi:oligopeptide/dipeptide ABC transporter ATP-binding protein
MTAALSSRLGDMYMPETSVPLLQVSGLTARIASHEVLTDVALALDTGQLLGLVGETGSGKTLACRSIMGLMPRLGGEITGGTVVLNGTDISGLPEREWHRLRGRELAFVPQGSLTGLDPVMKVGRQITETVRILDPEARVDTRVRELLEMVELTEVDKVLSSYPHQLSGGMRQRVMIALAIAGRPRLLLADEPTTALDVTVQRSILELLRMLCLTTGMGMVIVTHDLGVIETVTDRVAIMYAGTTVETGSTQEVLARPQHPYTRALLSARPSARNSGERLVAIGGQPPGPGEWPEGCRFATRCPRVQDQCVADRPTLTLLAGGHPAACIRQSDLVE